MLRLDSYVQKKERKIEKGRKLGRKEGRKICTSHQIQKINPEWIVELNISAKTAKSWAEDVTKPWAQTAALKKRKGKEKEKLQTIRS
jgi:hypothetical protein